MRRKLGAYGERGSSSTLKAARTLGSGESMESSKRTPSIPADQDRSTSVIYAMALWGPGTLDSSLWFRTPAYLASSARWWRGLALGMSMCCFDLEGFDLIQDNTHEPSLRQLLPV